MSCSELSLSEPCQQSVWNRAEGWYRSLPLRTMSSLVVCCCFAALQWTGVALAMMGKLGIAGAFATLYIFSSEIFPTVVRNSGIGASSLCARVGGILAPYIANMVIN